MVVNWNSVLQVLALNCVDESNEEICRNYSVMVNIFDINNIKN